jgi:quercetin dioxygenase-like cupin family protein
MSEAYTLINALPSCVEMPEDGILSKPISTNNYLRATLFALSAGQEMSEHTTTMEALLQILEGEADLTLGDDPHRAGPGAWIRMSPNLRHSITAVTPLKMLLVVLRDAKAPKSE